MTMATASVMTTGVTGTGTTTAMAANATRVVVGNPMGQAMTVGEVMVRAGRGNGSARQRPH